jgi:hypothetical protein
MTMKSELISRCYQPKQQEEETTYNFTDTPGRGMCPRPVVFNIPGESCPASFQDRHSKSPQLPDRRSCCSVLPYPTLLRTTARPCFPRNHSVCKINDLEKLAMGRSYGINVTIGPALGSDRIGPARMQENLSTTGHSSCRSHLSCHNHSTICYLRGIATYFLRKKMRRAEQQQPRDMSSLVPTWYE